MDREAIVKQARRVVEAEGIDSLSVRGLARDLGVSAPALYEYIESKEELLRLLAQDGYATLAHRWDEIGGPPIDWLAATAAAYVDFAVDNPGLFSLMHRFGPAALVGDTGIEHPSATTLFDRGRERIEAAIAAGELVDRDPLELATGLWAAAHGVATVALMAHGLIDHRTLIEQVTSGLLTGWRPDA